MIDDKLLFSNLKRIHIVGIAGTLMAPFACYLKQCGFYVTGSDQNIYPPMSDLLLKNGITFFHGYDFNRILKESPDLVVIGNVIRKDNPEAQGVIKAGLSYCSLPELMERFLIKETKNIIVAGTHGKTTTTSMLAHVLRDCGLNPNYFIGGVAKDLPFSFYFSDLSSSSFSVLEGDEYDTSFWDKTPKFNHYLPNHVLLTSVEYDHADIYPDFFAVVNAFEGLIGSIQKGGQLIACFDSIAVRKISEKANVPIISYGTNSNCGAKYIPGNIFFNEKTTVFDILDQSEDQHHPKKVSEVVLNLPGNHNILNALAVWIECSSIGLAASQIEKALKIFQGVRRRQEVCFDNEDFILIDDFAHHPTAVRETLRSLKNRYPTKRLIAVFEPRSATSRRKIFQNDYVGSFQEADHIVVSCPFDQTKINASDHFSSKILVEDLNNKHKMAIEMQTVEEGIEIVLNLLRSHRESVIVVLSNGGFNGFIQKLISCFNNL